MNALITSTRLLLRSPGVSSSFRCTALKSSATLVSSSWQRSFYPHRRQHQQNQLAMFSDDQSHSDFAPQRKQQVPEDVDEAIEMIKGHVKNNRVMLYMKGNPSLPMCGFSSQVVNILKNEEVDFASVNVLDYPAIREGVKKFGNWPTIPQLYVNGELIGGCDIIVSMHESGELKELLKGQEE